MEKQNKQQGFNDKNIQLVLIVLIIVSAIFLGFFMLDKMKKDAYTTGWENGQKNLVMSIRISGEVPVFSELGDNVTMFDWIPIQEICIRGGICTAWCDQLKENRK